MTIYRRFFGNGLLLAILFAGCGEPVYQEKGESEKSGVTKVSVVDWGTADGKEVKLFTLLNGNGTEIKITNYGGIITSYKSKDRNGKINNVVLGFDSLAPYLGGHPYFGALIGRYGNRIGGGKFMLDGKPYQLPVNSGKNHLHGGFSGFDKVVWDAQTDTTGGKSSIILSYLSKDGEEGYPGNLAVKVSYTLTDADELLIHYTAETDKTTIINLTNHSYFNLSGDFSTTILNHQLQVKADKYTPVDSLLVPTGDIVDVSGTPFDFREPIAIGSRISNVEGGYDINFVLQSASAGMELVATLYDTLSGRQLEVITTQPGLQVYSGNFLNGSLKNRDGNPIIKHGALCLETQHFPDAPNKPGFPSTVLKPGEKYSEKTIYKITVRK